MWRAFHCQLRRPGWHKLGVSRRLAVLSRCVKPIFLRGMAATPYSETLSRETDVLQRKMFASVLRVPKGEIEEVRSYVRRRARLASNVCQEYGLWSHEWARQAVKWDEHLARDSDRQRSRRDAIAEPLPTSFCWAASLRFYRDETWLAAQTETVTRNSARCTTMTRTRTRDTVGIVFPRWGESIAVARQKASHWSESAHV
eukprot:TRINITY_DN45864_c0_g1_i1.p1 TRINITY_DN45864_c0_g1~~TRINITY_DN45864_c0_g1_i1.p1  ORF type:complete len:200 (-),score=6.76 TRINITY_DN45864_c0_g1_i1:116-715(-)